MTDTLFPIPADLFATLQEASRIFLDLAVQPSEGMKKFSLTLQDQIDQLRLQNLLDKDALTSEVLNQSLDAKITVKTLKL